MKKKGKKNAVNIERKSGNIETTLKKQWIEKSIEFFKEGYSSSFIREYLKENKTGSRSDRAIDTVVNEAHAYISQQQFNRSEEMIPIHLSRYNKQIQRLRAVEDYTAEDVARGITDWEGFYKAREKRIKAYLDCAATSLQKEELLGFHRKGFVLYYNRERTVEINNNTPTFNEEKLSFDEQVELLQLVRKARRDENELLAIITVNKEEEGVTIDVEHEEVETPNVEQIKQETLPVPPKRSIITANDPSIKLRESLKLLAAKKFNEIGTLTEDEKKLLNK